MYYELPTILQEFPVISYAEVIIFQFIFKMAKRNSKFPAAYKFEIPFIISKEGLDDVESGQFCTVSNLEFPIRNRERASIVVIQISHLVSQSFRTEKPSYRDLALATNEDRICV